MTDPLDGLRVPPPAPELRDRVLAAARAASLQPRPHWIDRLYEDVVLRRAGLALIVAFLVLLILDTTPRRPAPTWQPRVFDEESPPDGEAGTAAAAQWPVLADELGLGEQEG